MLAGPVAATVPPYEFLSPAECAAAGDPDWPFSAARVLIGEPVDAAISAILQITGEASGSDRAWMFEYSADQTTFRNTHEWCRRSIPGYVQDLQDAPTTMSAWLHRRLVAGRAVMVNRIEALPRAARPLQAEMRRQADKSILAVPMAFEGRLRAAIGFDAVRQYHRWPEAEIGALFRCAELIALARYGRSASTVTPDRPSRVAPLIYLRGDMGVRGVEPSAIVCLRSARNHTLIHLADGSRLTDQRALGLWSSLLPPANFVKVHRTAIVNILHIRGVRRENDATTWLLDVRYLAESLSVSRSCRQELKTRLGF